MQHAWRAAVAPQPTARREALIVRLRNWVGEVVLAVPALRRLEERGYELHLVGKRWAAALLEGMGWRVTVHPSSLLTAAAALRALRVEIQSRQQGRSPRALLITTSFSSALEMRLAGLPASGYATDARRWLLQEAFTPPRAQHALHSYWGLISCFLRESAPYPASIDWRPSDVQQHTARELLAAQGLGPERFVLFCPFSGPDDRARRKVWPGFAALAGILKARSIPVVVCPGPGEEAAAAAQLPSAIRLAGVNLGVYGALQRLATAVVANDTGPGHLAAAAGARLIAIYGPHSQSIWLPVGPRTELVHETAQWPAVEDIAARIVT